jgi:hypothetical protein
MSGKLVYLVSFGLLLVMVGSVRADSNLVAHYEFSAEGDYSDSVPDGAAGQPQGDVQVIWDDERDSYVLSLDGDGDYVFYESEWHRLVADAITVAAWIKTDSLGSYDGVVGLGYAWRLYGGEYGNVIFQIMNTTPEATVIGTTDVNDGLWHHVAGSFDGTQYNLYVDGKLEATVATSGSISAGTAYYGCIGAHYKKDDERDPRRFFNGLIDDVRIYDRVLSESEVHYIFTFKPGMASVANPADGQTEVDRDVVLSWLPAETAVLHDVYFGADFNDVNDADPADTTGIYRGRQDTAFYNPDEILQWETTYYWRIDEVNDTNPNSPWIGSVWSFAVGNYLVVDDFEDYNYADNPIWLSWRDGLGYGAPDEPNSYAGNGTGSLIGEDETWPSFEPIFVHSGEQSMRYLYDNNKEGYAKYSEAERTLSHLRDWTEEDVVELSLWFIGRPAYMGSFTEGPSGTYTMTGSGTDIWGGYDELHFAFKMLSGSGSIIAKVESIDNTNDWAKAGVMIREILDEGSKHAMMAVTPGNGVWFGWRNEEGKDSFSQKQTGITAPHWVKLERDISGNFRAYHSSNGSTWQALGAAQNIQMNRDVYIGFALTSHDTDLTCEAVFSDVSITGTAGQQWTNQDIGIESNDPEPMYVAISNIDSEPAVVYNENPNAATIDIWTEWRIPLQTFADEGIDLTDVDRIAIGFGTKGNMAIPGGSGKMFIDDIRLYRPWPEPEPEPEQ